MLRTGKNRTCDHLLKRELLYAESHSVGGANSSTQTIAQIPEGAVVPDEHKIK